MNYLAPNKCHQCKAGDIYILIRHGDFNYIIKHIMRRASMRWYMDILNDYKVTEQDLGLNRFYMSECDRLGIDVSSFNSSTDFVYTRDEIEAIGILSTGKKLPVDLEQRLLATKAERTKGKASRKADSDIYTKELDEEFERLFG